MNAGTDYSLHNARLFLKTFEKVQTNPFLGGLSYKTAHAEYTVEAFQISCQEFANPLLEVTQELDLF